MGLLIIYQLIIGASNRGMVKYGMKTSSYQKLAKHVFKKYGSELDSWIDSLFPSMFSTPKIRLLYARKNNLNEFDGVTMMLDGHDTSINYHSIYEIMKKLYSKKLDKFGFRTQVVMNCSLNIIIVSDSVGCSTNNDGSHMVTMRVNKHMGR